MENNVKDVLMKNRNMVIIIVLVVVAVVAGVIYMDKSKSSSSSSTESPIVTLSNRVTAVENNYNSLDFPSQSDIDNLDTRMDEIEESYADYSDNMETLLQNISDIQAYITAAPTPTPTPDVTPTPTPTATPAPTATPTPTPTPTPHVNRAPVIDTFVVSPPVLEANEWYALVTVTAHDPDGDALSYTWAAGNGAINGAGASVYWVKAAANVSGSVGVIVSDGYLSDNYTATILCNP